MPYTTPLNFDSDSIASINLSRLLSRLDQKLSTPPVDSDGNLQVTSLEQAKMVANLEYARQLLHKLESSKVPPKRQDAVVDLCIQKQAIRRLNESLHIALQLEESISEDEDDEEVEPMEDDDYARLNPEPNEASTRNDSSPKKAHQILSPASSSSLRNRFPTHKEKVTNEKRTELFTSATPGVSGAAAEQLLDYQRQQQEDITGDLLKMAQILKESSLEFGKNLEEEKSYLDHAKEGLDKNSLGMQSAGKKIDDLRKNDTVSFYWSIIYMAIIMALAFFVLFVLFFAPKLRWW